MIRLDNTSEQSIITMLRDNNVLNHDQVKQIETLSKESGKSQLETAFELNITNDTKIAKLLSESFSIPLANLEQAKISKEVKNIRRSTPQVLFRRVRFFFFVTGAGVSNVRNLCV